MRIAIYHPWVYLKSGLERTIVELARRSRHDWTVYTSHYDPDGTFPELKSTKVVELQRVSVERRYGSVLAAAWRILATKLDPSSHDALVICCDGLGSLLTFRNHTRPTLCLCFTPLRAVYDEEYRARHLRKHRRILPLALLFEGAFRRLDRWAWRRYDRVCCISKTVKDRVVRGGLCAEDKIDIAFPGIPADHIAPAPDSERFFFLPGRIMWTKNIELGIEAFLRFRVDHDPEWRLVIAGMVDAKSRGYYGDLQKLAGPDSGISFEIEPDDKKMDELYRRCHAVLFTAFNEDLGLTPMEAMARGKPVIAVNRGGPTEIVLDGESGLLADCDARSFARAMVDLASDPDAASAMGRRGLERARLFTWETFVDAIDTVLDRLAASSGSGPIVGD